jgi:CheY-like chemotaxis protein
MMDRLASRPSHLDVTPTRTRVLVVDDYPETADLFAVLVEKLGCECRTAGTGRHALATVLEFDPHVVLLDLGLPDLSGFEVAQMLRTQSRGADRKIIALTGWATGGVRQRAADAGCDAFLVKPVSESKLRGVLLGTARVTA